MSQPDRLPTAEHPETEHPETQGLPRTRDIDRRTVIRGAGAVGVGVVGAATLAACGGDSGSKAGSAGSGAAGSATAAAKDTIKAADIPVGGGKVFDAAKIVVTQPKAGEFKAFSAICTHKGCTVAKVENGSIDCPCHGSKYDMATGAVTAGPAPAPLPPKTATVRGDSVTVT